MHTNFLHSFTVYYIDNCIRYQLLCMIFSFFFNEIGANNTLYKFYDTNILRYYIIQLLYRILYNQELCAFVILFHTRRYPFFLNVKNNFSLCSLSLSLSLSFSFNVPCAVLEEIEIYTFTRLHRHNVSLLLFILTISTVRYLHGSDILVCHE